MEVILAGSGNYVTKLAKSVTFCSFVEIKRIGCTHHRLAYSLKFPAQRSVQGCWVVEENMFYNPLSPLTSLAVNSNNSLGRQVRTCPLR